MISSITPTKAAEDRGMRKWFLWALVISLIFHAVLFALFRLKTLERYQVNTLVEQRLAPRVVFKRAAHYDPKIFESPEESKAAPKKDLIAPPSIAPPLQQKPVANVPDTTVLTPKATDLAKQIVTQKPNVNASKSVVQSQESATVQHEFDSMAKQLTASQPMNPRAGSEVKFSTSPAGPESTGTGTGAGFSDLEGLLAHEGPLTGPVAPVNMPGGALFEYNSAELRPEAVEKLQKVGQLIEHNPRATFSIEGHTDSFGTPDYNMKLSIARAEAVKKWLVDNMHVDASKVETKGFGGTKLIAPPTGTKEEQQINRRVEIVIRTPK